MAIVSEDEDYTFTWKIKNYSCCYQAKGDCIESPIFTLENLSGTQWSLWFYPKGESSLETSENFVSCFLEWKNGDEIIKPSLDYSIEILNEMGFVLECKGWINHVFSKDQSWGWPRFMPINKLETEIKDCEEDTVILRCRIKNSKLRKQAVFKSEACTVIGVDRRILEWNIKTHTLSELCESAIFSLDELYNFEVTLSSSWEGIDIHFYLKDECPVLKWPVMFKICLYDNNGLKIKSKGAKRLFKRGEKWRFPSLIAKNVLESCHPDSSKYEFKFRCEIYVSTEEMSSFIEKLHIRSYKDVDTVPKVASTSAMQNDFRSLYSDKKYSDLTILAGEKEFKVHKLVLRVRSPVFEAMLNQNMTESETGVVNVLDMDEQTMERFLEYIYTENVEIGDYESAKKLLYSADKYQVLSLVDMCATFLKSELSAENALELVTIADSITCECLKSYVLEYIILNATKILDTPDSKQWIRNNVELAAEILCKLSSDLIRRCR